MLPSLHGSSPERVSQELKNNQKKGGRVSQVERENKMSGLRHISAFLPRFEDNGEKAKTMKECTQCGKCCEKYGGTLYATEDDMERWAVEAPDLLEWADRWLMDLWFDPVTGGEFERCPWLRKLPRQEKYTCRIYANRPDCCRNYPVSLLQAINDGCEMVELSDLSEYTAAMNAEVKR